MLRYWRESPDDPATESIWVPVPQEYAIGFPEGHRQSAGGLDLQYGYDSQGIFNTQRLLRHAGQDRRQAARQSGTRRSARRRRAARRARRADQRDARWSGRQTSRLSARGSSTSTASSKIRKSRAMSATWRSGVPAKAAPAGTSDASGRLSCRRSGHRNSRLRATFRPASMSRRSSISARPAGLEADLYLRDVAGIGGDSVKAQFQDAGRQCYPAPADRSLRALPSPSA